MKIQKILFIFSVLVVTLWQIAWTMDGEEAGPVGSSATAQRGIFPPECANIVTGSSFADERLHRHHLPEFAEDHLVGKLGMDPVINMLPDLSFEEAMNLLSANRAYRHALVLWKKMAVIHHATMDGMNSVKDALDMIRSAVQETFRKEFFQIKLGIPRPEMMTSFLTRAQRSPFLWPVLLDDLQTRESETHFNEDAVLGKGVFAEVPSSLRRACLEFVTEGKNPDGTPRVEAKDAQKRLIEAVICKRDMFAELSPEGRHHYLEYVAARKNHDGTPGLGAEETQELLISFVKSGGGQFKGTSRNDRRTYLEKMVKQGVFDSKRVQVALEALQ